MSKKNTKAAEKTTATATATATATPTATAKAKKSPVEKLLAQSVKATKAVKRIADTLLAWTKAEAAGTGASLTTGEATTMAGMAVEAIAGAQEGLTKLAASGWTPPAKAKKAKAVKGFAVGQSVTLKEKQVKAYADFIDAAGTLTVEAVGASGQSVMVRDSKGVTTVVRKGHLARPAKAA